MKIVFSTISFMKNWKTIIVYFVLIPIFNIILLVLINAQFTNQLNLSVAIASVTISGSLIAMSSIVNSLVTDYQLKIDREIIAKNPFFIKYWINKIIVSFIIALILIIINLLLILCIQTTNNQNYLLRAILISPIVILSGINIGITAFVLSWKMNNIYFFYNLFATLTFIVSAVLVPIDKYPIWLKVFSQFFPYSNSIAYIINSNANWWIDIIIDIIWFLITLVIYNIQIKKIKL